MTTPLSFRLRDAFLIHDATGATGAGTPIVLKSDHANVVGLVLFGTWVGSVAFEVCLNPNGATPTWVPIAGRRSSDGVLVSSATANDGFVFDTSGFLAFRAYFTRTSGNLSAYAWNTRGGGGGVQGESRGMLAGVALDEVAQAVHVASSLADTHYEVTKAGTRFVTVVHFGSGADDIRCRRGAAALATSFPLVPQTYFTYPMVLGEELHFYNLTGADITVFVMERA